MTAQKRGFGGAVGEIGAWHPLVSDAHSPFFRQKLALKTSILKHFGTKICPGTRVRMGGRRRLTGQKKMTKTMASTSVTAAYGDAPKCGACAFCRATQITRIGRLQYGPAIKKQASMQDRKPCRIGTESFSP
jgi:hypothetical protein